jgi:ParB family chromosome partitioning protein
MSESTSTPEAGVSSKTFRRIDPAELVIDHTQNTRPFVAADAELMADSYEDEGQLQPIVARPGKNGALSVVDGFHRAEAAILYNARHPEQPMKVMVLVKNLNEEEAYIASAVANARRSNISPIVIAEQQRHMMESFGRSPEVVARLYGMDTDRLYTLAKLLRLPKKIKDMVTAKELPVIAAAELANLDREDQEKVLGMAARKSSGAVKGESVRDAIKKTKREKDGEIVQRNRKELIQFLENFVAVNEQENVRKVAKAILDFAEGKASEKKAERIFGTLGGAVKASVSPTETETETETDPEPKPKSKLLKKKVKKKLVEV